jgi:hypothetical protein
MSLTIADIDAKIQALLDNPQVDYQEGDVRVSASQKLVQLIEVRKHLVESPDSEIEQMTFDDDIDEFGVDNSQYES